MSSSQLRQKYANFRVALLLDRAGYHSTVGYLVGDYTADLLVQRPYELPFVVQVLNQHALDAIVAPNESVREELSRVFCAPVYFAVVQQAKKDIVSLEAFLVKKVLYGDDIIVVELAT